MLNVEHFLHQHYPDFCHRRPRLSRLLTTFLRLFFREREFQHFAEAYPNLRGIQFARQVLNYFQFTVEISGDDKARIPTNGRVVIAANHPIGSLDGLALLALVGEIRRDVKIVANQMLTAIEPLKDSLLHVDVMNGKTSHADLYAIEQHLNKDGALIIFPAGEVSRLSIDGIRDTKWKPGFLRYAEKTAAPIVPAYIKARNSLFFYVLSLAARPLSTPWLVRELFKQRRSSATIIIGNPVTADTLRHLRLPRHSKASLFRQHLYRIGHYRTGILPSQESIAVAVNRRELASEMQRCPLLRHTVDGMSVYLFQGNRESLVMAEVGRLREVAFRTIGEGTGKAKDLDRYDDYYSHLLLWHPVDQQIVGAYRFVTGQLRSKKIYSQTLFRFAPPMFDICNNGMELGRSFVQPSYQGRRSLDYLWRGIGAYLNSAPETGYLFGAVSLSAALPKYALEMLVYFYQLHFPPRANYASARTPFQISIESQQSLAKLFPGENYCREFLVLKRQLKTMSLSVPTLFKQYSELCEPGGVQFAAFSIDANFGYCVDGLIIVDLKRLKPRKRARYIGD